jgi:hypothetical protein
MSRKPVLRGKQIQRAQDALHHPALVLAGELLMGYNSDKQKKEEV